jgi:hypothetical protein
VQPPGHPRGSSPVLRLEPVNRAVSEVAEYSVVLQEHRKMTGSACVCSRGHWSNARPSAGCTKSACVMRILNSDWPLQPTPALRRRTIEHPGTTATPNPTPAEGLANSAIAQPTKPLVPPGPGSGREFRRRHDSSSPRDCAEESHSTRSRTASSIGSKGASRQGGSRKGMWPKTANIADASPPNRWRGSWSFFPASTDGS